MPPETPPPRFVAGGGGVPSPEFDYQEDSAEAQKGRQNRAWSDLTFKIRYRAVVAITLVAGAIALATLALLGWLVVIFLVHYTIPQLGWLNEAQLSRLTGAYRNFAAFAVPAMLIANTWLVAWFGSRWFRSNSG